MNINVYQDQAMSVRLETADEQYALQNLVSEVGELFGHLAKARRDGRKPEHEMLVKKELGDILWSLAVVAADNGWTLEDIAQSNLNKLFSRRDRGTLQGSGDNR
jgi:NTP pyrophosphatase (non-canonical NTP hydrolase)